jgi:predicted DCC family thiol-disulfide oxidoreductase YuxK
MSVLVFDGDCGFCTAAVHLAERLAPAVTTVPWQRADLESLGLTSEECSEALQFVGDRRGAGAVAVGELLRAARQPWPVAGRILLLPGIVQVAGVAYRFIAAHRGSLPGATPACQL